MGQVGRLIRRDQHAQPGCRTVGVGPTANRGNVEDTRVAPHVVQAAPHQIFHGPSRCNALLLQRRHEGWLLQSRGWMYPAAADTRHEVCRLLAAFVKIVVRVGFDADQHTGMLHQLRRDIGVAVQRGDDRGLAADNISDGRQQGAFRITVAFATAAAVQLQKQASDFPGRLQCLTKLGFYPGLWVGRDHTAESRCNQRNRDDLKAMVFCPGQKTAESRAAATMRRQHRIARAYRAFAARRMRTAPSQRAASVRRVLKELTQTL